MIKTLIVSKANRSWVSRALMGGIGLALKFTWILLPISHEKRFSVYQNDLIKKYIACTSEVLYLYLFDWAFFVIFSMIISKLWSSSWMLLLSLLWSSLQSLLIFFLWLSLNPFYSPFYNNFLLKTKSYWKKKNDSVLHVHQ